MSRPSVASVVGDAGGAEALAPVLVSLARRGMLGPVVSAPAGMVALERAGVAFDRLEANDAESFVDSVGPSMLLCTTSWGDHPVELPFIAAARTRGIPSLAVIDFWSNYRRRFESGGQLTLPDLIAVPDDAARLEAAQEGLPADRLVALGNPCYESLIERYGDFDRQARTAFRARVGVGRQVTLVLFASQPLNALYGDDLGYDERGVLTAVHQGLEQVAEWLGHPVELAVRAHPREDRLTLPEPGARVRLRSAAGDDALGWALAADLVVGMTSAVLLQAAMLGARVVSVQPNLRGPDRLPSNRLGLTDGVYQSELIPAALYRALARSAHTQSARVLHRLRVAASGATARFGELIDQMARDGAGVAT
jgi:hypothetical protein